LFWHYETTNFVLRNLPASGSASQASNLDFSMLYSYASKSSVKDRYHWLNGEWGISRKIAGIVRNQRGCDIRR
jgi:hypothetical protein